MTDSIIMCIIIVKEKLGIDRAVFRAMAIERKINFVVVVLPVQLILCFKSKSMGPRFVPIMIFAILAMLSIIMNQTTTGWVGLAHIFFAIYALFMIFMCGIGWGIWAVASYMKKKK